MLATYFPHPTRLTLIRHSPAAPYLDGFIASMIEAGYQPPTIQSHLRTAAHLSYWLQQGRRPLTDLNASTVEGFKQHLPACQCPGYRRSSGRHAAGTGLFFRYLRKTGIIVTAELPSKPLPPLFVGFCHWMRQHRGAKDTTLRAYGRIILDVLCALGDDPQQFDAARLRAFVLDRASRHGRSKAKLVVTTLRTFVRYLITQGFSPVGLDAAIPVVAGWRLDALPRYLPASDVERLLAACNPATEVGSRDRAVLLLLSRLGLRAGDVCSLRLWDIDWEQATVQVMGKSRRTAQLPLPQEVGDALLHYLTMAHRHGRSEYLFLRMSPPVSSALTSSGISGIVRRAIERAGVLAPACGARVLRNSAATSLLADGASLQSIAVLLRHRSLDTTTLYAKVDFKVLRQLARAWPEVSPC